MFSVVGLFTFPFGATFHPPWLPIVTSSFLIVTSSWTTSWSLGVSFTNNNFGPSSFTSWTTRSAHLYDKCEAVRRAGRTSRLQVILDWIRALMLVQTLKALPVSLCWGLLRFSCTVCCRSRSSWGSGKRALPCGRCVRTDLIRSEGILLYSLLVFVLY